MFADLSNRRAKMWRAHFLHFHHGSSGRSSSSTCVVSCKVQEQCLHTRSSQMMDVKIMKPIFTRGTSLSTTVFRISIHSVRFCLLMSSRGRLYCRDSFVMKKRKDGSTEGRTPPRVRFQWCNNNNNKPTECHNVSQLRASITWKRAYRILKICFCTSTDSLEWSGRSWIKRSFSMGMKMCMAATKGWRSSGFLYLFHKQLTSSQRQCECNVELQHFKTSPTYS